MLNEGNKKHNCLNNLLVFALRVKKLKTYKIMSNPAVDRTAGAIPEVTSCKTDMMIGIIINKRIKILMDLVSFL